MKGGTGAPSPQPPRGRGAERDPVSYQAEVGFDLIPGDAPLGGDLRPRGAGRLDVRQVLGRLEKAVQVFRVDHRGHAPTPGA